MLIVPGRWFRNRRSDLVCQVQRVAQGLVWVRYHGSRVDRKHPITQFVEGFDSVPKPN